MIYQSGVDYNVTTLCCGGIVLVYDIENFPLEVCFLQCLQKKHRAGTDPGFPLGVWGKGAPTLVREGVGWWEWECQPSTPETFVRRPATVWCCLLMVLSVRTVMISSEIFHLFVLRQNGQIKVEGIGDFEM